MASPLTLSPDEFKKRYGDITQPDSDVLLSLTPEEFNQRYNGKSAPQIEQPPAKPISLAEKAFKSFGAASAGVIGEPAAAAIDILGGVDTAAAIRKRLSEVQAGVQREVPELGKEFKFEDLQDPSFYATKGVSVLPALIALVGTGAGAVGVGARGAAGLASRLGAGAKGLKAAKAIGEIGTSALVSRTLEGALEASGTYNQLLNEGVDRDKAADAAAKVFRNNYALTGMDAAQYAAATLKLPPALSKGLVKWAANAVKLGVASGSEGLEELYQGYVAKSAQEYAKGMSSIDGLDAKEFWDYATRAPLWEQEEFVIGSLFGLGFQVGEGALAKYGKTEGELRQAVKRNPQEVIQTLKGQADDQRADNATREQVAQQAFGKKFDDLTDEQKQKIVDKSAEQKTAEEDARIDETLQGVTEQAGPLEEISQKVYGKPYAELPLAQRQALKKRYQTLADKAQAKKVDEAIAEKVGLKKQKPEKPARKEAQPPVAEAAATASTAAERTALAAEPVALKPEVVTPQAEISPSQKAVAPSPVSARAGEEPQPSKTAVVEKPIAEIETDVDRFQNRATEFSEKTAATVAERFDPNLFDPIVLWKDPQNGKEYVLSGHSRLEGMKRRGAKNIPSRYFQGTEAEAMNFAKVEANRLGSAENLQETIKAYKQAKRGNATKSKLKDLFDGDVDFLESAQNLNESGDFIRYLGQGAATEFPYIKRFSRWVGELRKTHGGKITDRHEQQIFDWLYKGEKRNREIEKDRFFELVDNQVSRTDFNPNAPLQLKRGEAPKIGTRGRADTAKLEDELDQLRADKKNARTPAEAQAIDKEIARVESAIKTLVKTQPDLFGEAEARPAPKETTTPTHKEFDRAFETFQEVAAKQTGKPVPEQSAAIAEELRSRNVPPVIIDELTNPRRALKPRDPESERSATSRPERIARAAKPSPTLKPKVDAVAQANVDFRNKEAALLKAREEIKADIEARGGEVVVDTDTGAMTITLRPGKAKISEADQALIERLRAEAADAGAYSLATVGQGFEVSATPERIADAKSLPAGDFKARALEFLKRNAEAKAAEKVFKQEKEDARNDLVDYYLAERAAGKETPSALLGLAKDGTKVEVMARRVRSAAEPDLTVGGRDFPQEIAEAKQKAKERATETGEPFIETRKAGERKVTQAKERGAFVAEQSEGYQPNRPGDFLFNPEAVFEKKPYEPNYKKRPDATPRTDRLAKEAVEAIGHNRRRGRVYLANAIDASARETGTVTLVGQTIRTSDDLAVLAQVYRDPRWETLRYVFVKDGKVVNVTGISNRLPSAASAYPFASREDGLKWLKGLMDKTGADGYYLLHNHPSGVSKPSQADIEMTVLIASKVPGFKEHVVIDSNEFSVLSITETTNKETTVLRKTVPKNFGEDRLLKPSIDHPLIGRVIASPDDVLTVAKGLEAKDGWVTLISTSQGRVRGIMQVEEPLMKIPGKRRSAIIRNFARQTGGADTFAVVSDDFMRGHGKALSLAVERGFIRDAVTMRGYSITDMLAVKPNREFSFGKIIKSGRVVKEGEAKKQLWEMTRDELIVHQIKYSEDKITAAKQKLLEISSAAPRIEGNLTRRKDKSDLKKASEFSKKFQLSDALYGNEIKKRTEFIRQIGTPEGKASIFEFHRKEIAKALQEGKQVPKKVLEEYTGKDESKAERLSRLLPPETPDQVITNRNKKKRTGKNIFSREPIGGFTEADLVPTRKPAKQEIPDTITVNGKERSEEPSIVREPESTYGKANLSREQFLDLGKMVNDFLQSKEQLAKLSKEEREEFAVILGVLKEYKELSEKADLSPSEKMMLKYAIRDIESPEGKRVIEKVQAALRDNKPIEASWLDKIAEWTASMYLWRLASVGSSIGSNLFRQLLKYPELKLAAWFNQGVARQTRVERTRFSEEAEKDFRDAWTGEEFKKAARKALDIMQEKPDAAEESKFFEREKVKRKSIGGKKGKFIRAGLNAQAAIDVLFRQPATTAAIARYSFREAAKTSNNRVEQAKKANAIAQNVRRLKALKDAKQEVPEYLEKFEPILAKAESDAEAQTFQSELDGFMKHVSEIRRYPLARIFVPFFNTRMNILLQAYARTPLSAFGSEFRDLGAKYLKKSLTAEEAGKLSDRMAEITLGTAAFLVTTAALYGLSDDDEELITGDFDEKTIGEKPAGWLPNAVRVGDTYVSMKGFEPYATIFTAFGNAASGKKSGIRNAGEALAKAAFSNPMTDELFDIMGSLKDGDADKFFVAMVAGAATPGLLQDISKIADPTIRAKEGLEEQFKSRVGIPGLSTTLPERIDVFGDGLEPQTSGERALKAVTGVSISKSKEDPARREIRKLGLKHSLNTITHKGVSLEPWEVLALNKSIGKQYHETVLKLLQNPTYLAADKEARKAKLRSVRKGLIDKQKAILEKTPYFIARERVADAQKEARERVKEQLAE